jgi:hypothetical protein
VEVALEAAHVDELERGLAAVREQGVEIAALRREDFPLGPALGDLVRRMVSDCRDGAGSS